MYYRARVGLEFKLSSSNPIGKSIIGNTRHTSIDPAGYYKLKFVPDRIEDVSGRDCVLCGKIGAEPSVG